jgi:hypothetical protein
MARPEIDNLLFTRPLATFLGLSSRFFFVGSLAVFGHPKPHHTCHQIERQRLVEWKLDAAFARFVGRKPSRKLPLVGRFF